MPESLFPGPGVFRISVSSKYFNLKHLSKIIMIELCLILSESLFLGPDMTILIHNSLLHISSWQKVSDIFDIRIEIYIVIDTNCFYTQLTESLCPGPVDL